MSEISNYDYSILEYIHDSEEPVSMAELTEKFDQPGRAAVKNMCRLKLLFWDLNDDLWHDDSCAVKLTDSGLVAYQSHKYDRQLESRERWKERVIGYIWGLVTSALTYLITKQLIPAAVNLIQTLEDRL